MDSRLIECTFSPVTKREVAPRFGGAGVLACSLEYLDTLRNQIFGPLLIAFDLMGTAEPPGQSAHPQQQNRPGQIVQFLRFRGRQC